MQSLTPTDRHPPEGQGARQAPGQERRQGRQAQAPPDQALEEAVKKHATKKVARKTTRKAKRKAPAVLQVKATCEDGSTAGAHWHRRLQLR